MPNTEDTGNIDQISKEDELSRERGSRYVKQWKKWREDLADFYKRVNENYKQYTGNKEQNKGTASKITDPMAFEFVERMVPRLLQRKPDIIAKAKGGEYLSMITPDGEKMLEMAEKFVKGVLEYLWESPEMAESSDVMSVKLLPQLREWGIAGNTFGEIYWNITRAVENYKTEDKKDEYKAKIIYDAPDYNVMPIERLVFNPAMSIKQSDIYYVEKYVTYDELKNKEIREEDGIIKGVYKNLDLLKKEREEKGFIDDENEILRDKDARTPRKHKPIRLLERWQGAKLFAIAEDGIIVREEFDPCKVGGHPLIIATNYELVNQPVGYSEIDPIKEMARAKDTIVNQRIDIINKALKPPLRIDPNGTVKIESLANAYAFGGPVYASQGAVEYMMGPSIPNDAFMQTNEFQARAESALDMSGYVGGTPQAYSDKTKGTMGGTMAMIEQSQPRLSQRTKLIEEQIIKPILRKWLKMLANLMDPNETKWMLIGDVAPQWVGITKDLLQGKLTLPVKDEEGNEYEEEFDIDWIIDIETGSMAASDRQVELQNYQSSLESAKMLGIIPMMDKAKWWINYTKQIGVKRPEQYLAPTPPPNYPALQGQAAPIDLTQSGEMPMEQLAEAPMEETAPPMEAPVQGMV